MEWKSLSGIGGTWSQQITNLEAKQLVAKRLAERLQPGDVVGIGSGSTAFLTVQALANRAKQDGFPFTAIPTSHEVGLACASLGITTTSLNYKRPDWSFDGCDEVDEGHNMIKGRGGCMFREKLLMSTCPEVYIVADNSKLVKSLGTTFPVPVEVYPDALLYVTELLTDKLGATRAHVRAAGGKDGPVITETGNIIIDTHFESISPTLERELKAISGVIETGLFWGFQFELVTG